MSGINLEAAQRGVKVANFIAEAEAAFRIVVSTLAVSAQAEGLTFQEAVAAITTGGQAAVTRLIFQFGTYDSAEDGAAVIHAAVDEMASRIYAETADSIKGTA